MGSELKKVTQSEFEDMMDDHETFLAKQNYKRDNGDPNDRSFVRNGFAFRNDLKPFVIERRDFRDVEFKSLQHHRNLIDCSLKHCDFRGSDLEFLRIENSEILGCTFSGSNMVESSFKFVDMHGCDLSGVDFTSADFEDSVLCCANLSDSNLTKASLARVKLLESRLNGVNLSEVGISQCYIHNIEGKKIFTFQIGKHCGHYIDGFVRIGCITNPLDWWLENYRKTGSDNLYSEVEIEDHGALLRLMKERFESAGTLGECK